ncbi:MAG: flagellar motor switch protein FliN [Peptococcaceae bacterium]|nr:flagellar motor switch protein FliN [Peptococcaceae bacterium]
MMTEEEIRSFLGGGGSGVRKVKFPALEPVRDAGRIKTSLSHLEDVQVEISVELGQATMKVGELLGLVEGSVIKLEKAVGDAVEVVMNQQRFARGEVIIINDSFGVRITSINHAHNLKLSEGLV